MQCTSRFCDEKNLWLFLKLVKFSRFTVFVSFDVRVCDLASVLLFACVPAAIPTVIVSVTASVTKLDAYANDRL